ncbi:MAG: sigma-70 domain-containing protein [Lachnospiraceae bacterium]
MDQEKVFAKTLEEIRALAKLQGNRIESIQVEEAFKAIGICREQLEPVYEYLQSKHIGIDEEAQEIEMDREDSHYLDEYLKSLGQLPMLNEGEKRAFIMAAMAGEEEAKGKILQAFLPQVVDIARLYSGQGIFLEDLIGEGNLALAQGIEMLGCLEEPGEAEGMLGKMIMDAMEEAVELNSRIKQADQGIADKINRVSELAGELAESLRRKVTISELAEETVLTVEEIHEALRLSGNRIEHIEG